MVSMLDFYFDDPSSNPTEVCNFCIKLLLIQTKIKKKEAVVVTYIIGHFRSIVRKVSGPARQIQF